MSFASANRTALYRVKEVAWGTTPANPALINSRYTGESLDDTKKTDTSKEIRADRMTADLIVVDDSPAGDVNFELSLDTFKDLIESALMSTFGAALAVVGVAGDISTVLAVSPAANLTSTTAGKFAGITVGQWIKLGGFANPGNNGFFQVTTVISNQSLSITPEPAAAETPALALATIGSTASIRNGVLEQSYSYFKLFNDATVPTYHNFTGMRVATMSLDLKTGALITGKFGHKGKAANYGVAAPAGATFPVQSSTGIMNCINNIQSIQQNGAVLGSPGSVMSASLVLDNQHREQKGLGVLGNVGVVAGSLSIKVTASQYFESKAQADMFSASTAFSFSFQLKDGAGNVMIVTLPKCKYDSFKENATAINTDVMAATSFTALLDPVSNCMIQVDLFAGP